jgi:ATP-dependent DNA ligase
MVGHAIIPNVAAALHPLLSPMEAISVTSLPEGNSWLYEPKWDGFRCLPSRTAIT